MGLIYLPLVEKGMINMSVGKTGSHELASRYQMIKIIVMNYEALAHGAYKMKVKKIIRETIVH